MEVRALVFLSILIFIGCAKTPQLERSNPQFLEATEKNVLYFIGHTSFDGHGVLGKIDLRFAKKEFSPRKIHPDATFSIGEAWSTVYVVNSFKSDTIQLFDKKDFTLKTEYQIPNTNGQIYKNILPLSESEAYLTLHKAKGVLKIDPRSGNILKNIDLSKYAPQGNTVPMADKVQFWKDKVVVSLQRLKSDWFPENKGTLVILNPKTDAIENEYELKSKNPASSLLMLGDEVWIGAQGETMGKKFFSEGLDEGLEKLKFGNKIASEVFMSSKELMGKPIEVVGNEEYLWVITLLEGYAAELKKINKKTKEVKDFSLGKKYMGLQGLVYDATRKLVFVGLREKTQPKILVFDATDDKLKFAYDVDYLPTQLILSN